MLYKDSYEVLDAITKHLGNIFSEAFTLNISSDNTYADYVSKNYSIKVLPSFIQARTTSDFQVPIENRVDEVLANITILPNKKFCFSCRMSKGEIPFEYFCYLIE